MSVPFEDIVKDVAKQNAYGLRMDDPILILATIMNHVVDDQTASMRLALEEFRTKNEETAYQWRHDAKETANRILNAAINAGREAMVKNMSEGAREVVAMVDREVVQALQVQKAEFDRQVRQIKTYMHWLLATTGLALIGAAFIASIAAWAAWTVRACL